MIVEIAAPRAANVTLGETLVGSPPMVPPLKAAPAERVEQAGPLGLRFQPLPGQLFVHGPGLGRGLKSPGEEGIGHFGAEDLADSIAMVISLTT
jgi:hypothetical protein